MRKTEVVSIDISSKALLNVFGVVMILIHANAHITAVLMACYIMLCVLNIDKMELNKEIYELIENECDKHKEETSNLVDVGDVIYSFLYSTDECFHILNDWDEGRNNDPFWNDELNEHSAIVFLKQICDKLKQYYT